MVGITAASLAREMEELVAHALELSHARTRALDPLLERASADTGMPCADTASIIAPPLGRGIQPLDRQHRPPQLALDRSEGIFFGPAPGAIRGVITGAIAGATASPIAIAVLLRACRAKQGGKSTMSGVGMHACKGLQGREKAWTERAKNGTRSELTCSTSSNLCINLSCRSCKI